MRDAVSYDKTDPVSIERYGKGLIGKTFADVCREDDMGESGVVRETDDYEKRHEDKRRKGGLGELIEERYFHYRSNSEAKPDFDRAGVELKVTPYKIRRDGSVVAKERLILTMIDYFSVLEEPFEESHLWQKSKLLLLVYYLYEPEIQNRLDYKIGYVGLFTPPEQDRKVIGQDYEKIVAKIRAGKAHELSEGDTLYLSAAPKAATSLARRSQPCSEEPAKPRAFALKSSYMTYVLNNYLIPGKVTYEPILREQTEQSFEAYVTEKINAHRYGSVEELCAAFSIEMGKRPKNLGAILAYRILGIQGNRAEEFEKANVVVKTIRLEKNGKIRESMSFPAFRFKELVGETWEDSAFGNYLRETRFLFVVYQFDENDVLRLNGCQFWNIPYRDLEGNVRTVWEKTKAVLEEGLKVTVHKGRYGNNLPKASEDPVCHVRPHGRNAKDTCELPDGRQYTKQCFWLSNAYILSQLDGSLKGSKKGSLQK